MEDWVMAQQKALAVKVPGSMQCLEDVSHRGLVVTTHYSGTGAAEIATGKIFPGKARFHSACDINPTCQRVLLNHGPECAAEHVTTDLLARPPKVIVDRLKSLLVEYREQAEVRASTPGNDRREVVAAVGLEWVKVAMEVLEQWTPAREDAAYCLRHDRGCPAFPPRAVASTPGHLHLEIDGINCQPWTAAGKRMGWLDVRSLPCLILVRIIVCIEPDAVCLECTPEFDFATMQKMLCGYRGNCAITSPLDFGRPVARKRMYMWFDRVLSLNQVHREVSTILDVSRRSLLVGPEIFARASNAEVQRSYYSLAKMASTKPNGPPLPSVPRRLSKKQPPASCNLRVRDVLPVGLRGRYEAHRVKVDSIRTSTGLCYVRDINKSAGWGGKPQCQHVPTILRSSTLVAMFDSKDQDRLILPTELPSIHGIILPANLMSQLAPRELMSLTGNSMHVAQIGTFIQYAFATRTYKLKHISRAPGTSESAIHGDASVEREEEEF